MRTQFLRGLQRSALWQFFNCKVSIPLKQTFSFPLKFTLPYKICLLEKCLAKDYETEKNRQWLELCWQKTIELHETAAFSQSPETEPAQ